MKRKGELPVDATFLFVLAIIVLLVLVIFFMYLKGKGISLIDSINLPTT